MYQGVPLGGEPTCYLDTTQAAAVLGLSPRTLEHYRVAGGGPPFLTYCNRVHYLRADLDAWALESRRRSTSDDGGGEDGRRRDSSAGGARASVETASGRAVSAGEAEPPTPEDAARPARTGELPGTAGNGSAQLSVDELAALLQVSRRTLDRYRARGAGPAFEKVDGRVRYARANVEAWLASGRRFSRSGAGKETQYPAGAASRPDGGGPDAGGDGAEDV